MIARDHAYVDDAALREGTPSSIVCQPAEERPGARAEHHDPARIRLRLIVFDRVEVRLEPGDVTLRQSWHAEAVANVRLLAAAVNERAIAAEPRAEESGFAARAHEEIGPV